MSSRSPSRPPAPPSRIQRFIFLPVAVLALGALGLLVNFLLGDGGNDDALAQAVDRQIAVLRTSAADLAATTDAGTPAEALPLQQFAQLMATVDGELDAAPELVSGDRVYAYAQAVAEWKSLLDRVVVTAGAEDALAAARAATDAALLAVARYYNARPDEVPSAASGAGARN